MPHHENGTQKVPFSFLWLNIKQKNQKNKNPGEATMKKLLSLIMVMCLSVSLFAGCGGEETSSDATKAPSAIYGRLPFQYPGVSAEKVPYPLW